MHEAVAEIIGAGTVSEYDEAKVADIKSRFAARAGVAASKVSVLVVPASVKITVRIELPVGSTHGVKLPYGLELQIVGDWPGDKMDFSDPAYISLGVAGQLVAGR